MRERLGVVGTGAIACGLAATAARSGDVVVLARSEDSAQRARTRIDRFCERMEDVDASAVRVSIERSELADRTLVIEAVVEDLAVKSALLTELGAELPEATTMATTTSSLSVAALAAASGRPERFFAFHVFNPVPKMELVELVFPAEADQALRDRAWGLCEQLGKTGVVVPDTPGFVVNRLLFPYLFMAIELHEQTGLEPAAIDTCMKLGAAHPMGPLELLDFVGLDVGLAIGEQIGARIPERLRTLVAEGATGRKAGRGFYDY